MAKSQQPDDWFEEEAPGARDLYRPAEGKADPAIWVRELAVYQDWPPSQATLMRRIQLRRGLNILWAQCKEAGTAEGRISGHGAGKTTFCRLIRHVLCRDETAGTQEFRDRLVQKHANPWVLAEVHVAGNPWLVGRPLGRQGHHPFALAGQAAEQAFGPKPPRSGFEEYADAIERAVFGDRTRPAGEPRQWPYLLPWLSRDQECHFSGLVHWRADTSDHESPQSTKDERDNLMRLALGLVTPEEQKVLSEAETVAKEHETLVRGRSNLHFAEDQASGALASRLKMDRNHPDATLLLALAQAELKRLQKEALAPATDPVRERLQGERDRWKTQVDGLSLPIQLARTTLRNAENKLAGVTPAPPTEEEKRTRAAIAKAGPDAGYCCHPRDGEFAEKCPVSKFERDLDMVGASVAEMAARRPAMEREVARARQALAELEAMAAPDVRGLQVAEFALKELDERRKQEAEVRARAGTDATLLRVAIETLEAQQADIAKAEARQAKLGKRKEALAEELKKLSQEHRHRLDAFSRVYGHILRHLLGGKVTGRVVIKGKALVPEIEWHGQRSSAALDVTKYAAFDLAALALGRSTPACLHPGLLIHDSPRESDLARPIYTALFTAALEMEQVQPQPAFQYIITTTEPPPVELATEPWLLRPVLDASIAGERLLAEDV